MSRQTGAMLVGDHWIAKGGRERQLLLDARDLIDALRVAEMYRERLVANPGDSLQTHYAAQHWRYTNRIMDNLTGCYGGLLDVTHDEQLAGLMSDLLNAEHLPWDAAVIAACLMGAL